MAAVGAPVAQRLARRADLPELPHRHRDAQHGPDPLHERLRARRGAAASPPTRPSRRRPTSRRPGLSLYRFSSGHGGLACEALPRLDARRVPELPRERQPPERRRCRGTRACSPSARRATTSVPRTTTGGPHGMHAIGGSLGRRARRRASRTAGAAPAAPATAPTTAARALRRPRRPRSFSTRARCRQLLPRRAGDLLRLPRGSRATTTATRNRAPDRRDASREHAGGHARRARARRERPRRRRARCAASSSSPRTARSASRGAPRRYVPEPGFTGTDTSAGRPSTARSTRASPRERSRSAWRPGAPHRPREGPERPVPDRVPR